MSFLRQTETFLLPHCRNATDERGCIFSNTSSRIGIYLTLTLFFFCTSCVTPNQATSTFNKQLPNAIEQERSIAARCLEDEKKFGNVRHGMDQQDGSIEMNKWAGTLIKAMDAETHGSFEKQRKIILDAVHANGCLLILEELNRYYGLLSQREFFEAAKQSGQAPSDLSYRETSDANGGGKNGDGSGGRVMLNHHPFTTPSWLLQSFVSPSAVVHS